MARAPADRDTGHQAGPADGESANGDMGEPQRKRARLPQSENPENPDFWMDLEETNIVQELKRVSSDIDMMEMYSPRRVTAECPRFGLKPGEAMDLTNGWDFRQETSRAKAWTYIKKFKPRLIIGSPMCTMLSSLQNFTSWGEKEK